MAVVHFERDVDVGLSGGEREIRGRRRRLRERDAGQRFVERHRLDDDQLVAAGVAARRPHAEWNLDAIALAHVHVDLGARLLRLALDQALDQPRLGVDPELEGPPALGRDPDDVEVGAVGAGALLVRDPRRRALGIPEREPVAVRGVDGELPRGIRRVDGRLPGRVLRPREPAVEAGGAGDRADRVRDQRAPGQHFAPALGRARHVAGPDRNLAVLGAQRVPRRAAAGLLRGGQHRLRVRRRWAAQLRRCRERRARQEPKQHSHAVARAGNGHRNSGAGGSGEDAAGNARWRRARMDGRPRSGGRGACLARGQRVERRAHRAVEQRHRLDHQLDQPGAQSS